MITKQSTVNIRGLVLDILLQVFEEGQYSSVVLQSILQNYQYLEKKDRAFLTRLSEGTIESALELDYILNQFSKVKVIKMKPVIRNILRMGVYQIKYMEQVPDSAACNEAVKLTKKKGFHNLTGFVNGILRNISRKLNEISYPDEKEKPEEYLSIHYSMPIWIVEKWIADYGYEKTKKMISANFVERGITVRCNETKIKKEEFRKKLKDGGVCVEDGHYFDYAFQISDYNYIKKVPGFLEGEFFVQDESSMMVAEAAGIKEGDYIIDVCAAPGGKSLHCAEKLKGTGKVSSRDISERKVQLIIENKERLGLDNLEIKVWDARKLDEKNIEKADIVLADVPCSGLGVMGKKNDIKYKMTPQALDELVILQKEIIKNAFLYVKEGGSFIYSTCTVNCMENQEMVQWILEHFSCKLESMKPYLPQRISEQEESVEKGYLQLMPGIHNTDGFFVARFRKGA